MVSLCGLIMKIRKWQKCSHSASKKYDDAAQLIIYEMRFKKKMTWDFPFKVIKNIRQWIILKKKIKFKKQHLPSILFM